MPAIAPAPATAPAAAPALDPLDPLDPVGVLREALVVGLPDEPVDDPADALPADALGDDPADALGDGPLVPTRLPPVEPLALDEGLDPVAEVPVLDDVLGDV